MLSLWFLVVICSLLKERQKYFTHLDSTMEDEKRS